MSQDHLVRCRYLKRDGNQCTAEAAVPFAEALLCTRHISDAVDGFKLVQQLMWGEESCARQDREVEQRRRQEELRKVAGVVYYGEAWGYIKIGTSMDVGGRAADLKLTLLATEPGSYDLEKQRHRQFAEFRQLGECTSPQSSPSTDHRSRRRRHRWRRRADVTA